MSIKNMKNGLEIYFNFISIYDLKKRYIEAKVKVPGIIIIKNNIKDLVRSPNLFVSLNSFKFKRTCK